LPQRKATLAPLLSRTLPCGEGKTDLGGRHNSRSNAILIDHETSAMIVQGA